MKNSIKQYIRDKKGHPIGVMVAVKSDGDISFGWSLCNKCDSFSKELGSKIADNRARSGKSYDIPGTVFHPLDKFRAKAQRYFAPLKLVSYSKNSI